MRCEPKPQRSADWQSVVSPSGSRQAPDHSRGCGLPIRDTADCQSPLQCRGARFANSSWRFGASLVLAVLLVMELATMIKLREAPLMKMPPPAPLVAVFW